MILFVISLLLLSTVLFIRLLIPLGIALFIPSHLFVANHLISLAKINHGEKTLDLGSGDGRVVIAFSRAGAEAHGYEINPFLVLKSRRTIRQQGLEEKAFIHWGNFFFHSLSPYDVITIFISPLTMRLLEKKLRRELKPGARIISFKFPFPSWSCAYQKNEFYLYTKR